METLIASILHKYYQRTFNGRTKCKYKFCSISQNKKKIVSFIRELHIRLLLHQRIPRIIDDEKKVWYAQYTIFSIFDGIIVSPDHYVPLVPVVSVKCKLFQYTKGRYEFYCMRNKRSYQLQYSSKI